MSDLTQLREKFKEDKYAVEGLGAVIEDAREGFARCTMEIQPRHCNALGIPMGGVIFTLADFAFAVASNQHGKSVVTQASQITFLTSAKGKYLTAEAKAVREGSKICFYQITVTDDLNNQVAFATLNGYVVQDSNKNTSSAN